MNKKNKKIFYKKLDLIWRIIGFVVVLSTVTILVMAIFGVINNTFSAVVVISIFSYDIISIIVFLPKILTNFFKKLKKKLKKK